MKCYWSWQNKKTKVLDKCYTTSRLWARLMKKPYEKVVKVRLGPVEIIERVNMNDLFTLQDVTLLIGELAALQISYKNMSKALTRFINTFAEDTEKSYLLGKVKLWGL